MYNIYTRLRDEYPESTEHGETPLKELIKVIKPKVAFLNNLWKRSAVGSAIGR